MHAAFLSLLDSSDHVKGWMQKRPRRLSRMFFCLFVCFLLLLFFFRDVAVEQRKFFVVSSKCANCEERFFSSVLHLPPS